MCEHANSVPVLVTIPAELSHTGKERKDIKLIDSCISDIVRALNQGGVQTTNSCCGHGKYDGEILLKGGRKIIIKYEN